jgi:hypothetical protein
MHLATDRFPPGRDGVARLLDELAGLPEDALLFLARSYGRSEQAARDAAWDRVLEEATFRHREAAIDEIREAAIQLVTARHSAGDLRHASSPFGIAIGSAIDQPLAQAGVVNAIIEAAGAFLVADLVPDDVVDVLAGPVLDLLATVEEQRVEAERRRRDPYGLGAG